MKITPSGYITNTKRYRVVFKKKVERGLKKLPKEVRKLLFLLVEDLKADGPIQYLRFYRDFRPIEVAQGAIGRQDNVKKLPLIKFQAGTIRFPSTAALRAAEYRYASRRLH